ncbi:hypothetical protein SNE40_000118 [Patella caerulea]|uniref:Uncharacterized protein n=1 Tax=Patella caerulea TaxID=87958 RepID=A0AAN8KKE4_PATCE
MGTRASILTCQSPTVVDTCDRLPGKTSNGHPLRGDVTKRVESQNERNQKILDSQKKICYKAEELSDRVLEEKDRLSLHSKSRGTSRTTSRTASPSNNKKHVHFEPISDNEIQELNVKVNGIIQPITNVDSS